MKYTYEKLKNMKINTLKSIANDLKISNISKLKKEELINLILKFNEEKKEKSEEEIDNSNIKQEFETEKYRSDSKEIPQESPYNPFKDKKVTDDEEWREFPSSYNLEYLRLLPVNPNLAFAYWEIDFEKLPSYWIGLDNPRPVLVIYEGKEINSEFYIKEELPVELMSRNFYIHCDPGYYYYVTIIFRDRLGNERLFLQSNIISVPPREVSTDTREIFITIPFEKPIKEAMREIEEKKLYFEEKGKVISKEEFEKLYKIEEEHKKIGY